MTPELPGISQVKSVWPVRPPIQRTKRSTKYPRGRKPANRKGAGRDSAEKTGQLDEFA